MRVRLVLLSVLALTACAPAVPDSAAGVGFESYPEYLRNREARLNGAVPGFPAPGQPVFSTERLGAAIDAAETGTGTGPVAALPGPGVGAPLNGTRPRGNAPAGIAEQSGEMAAVSTGISDEQDFGAVASRETIESDKQRLEQQRAQYQMVQPTALPQRSGSAGPNIVEYALNTTNLPGVQVYRRSSIIGGNGSACGRYTSADLAQEAFLKAGGPERDSKRLDPDGDGFACGWDPRPFRAALR